LFWRVLGSRNSGRMAVMKRASNRIVWLVLILLLSVCSGCSREEPGVEIPLNTIWGFQMAETLDIQTLEPDHFGLALRQLSAKEQIDLYDNSLSHRIYFAIGRREDEKQPIRTGFAVAGTGREALTRVKKIMDEDQILQQKFPAGTDVSLFFFTRDSGWPVRIKSIVKYENNNTIVIQYYPVPHKLRGTHAMVTYRHFALIPIGKLSASNYVVDVVQTTERKYTGQKFQRIGKEFGEERVCKSFAFSVAANRKDETVNE